MCEGVGWGVSLHWAEASIVGGIRFLWSTRCSEASGRPGRRLDTPGLVCPAADLTRRMKGSRQAARLLLSLDVMMGWDSF